MAPKTKSSSTRKIDKIDRLVAIAAQECAEVGVELIFIDKEKDKDQNQGSFSHYNKELILMTGADDWVQILAHELGHLRQVKDGFFKSEDEYELFDDWLAGKRKLDMAEVIRCTRYIQNAELDAEKRALALLKEMKLLTPKQQLDYVKRGNCYALLWEVARRRGRWTNPKTPALDDPKIYRLLPDVWIEDVAAVPDDFEAAVVDNCY